MTILLLDLANFARRAAHSGLANEGSSFTFKFLRNLRALVAKIEPTSLVLVKEGSPIHRYEIFPEYKAQRRVKADDPKAEEKFQELMDLKGQIDEAINFCLKNLEVTVLKHAKLEADDLIASLVRELAKDGKDCVVASNDKDFEQLLGGEPARIRVYDLGKKDYMPIPTDYDGLKVSVLTSEQILRKKALLGDKSDNIPGVPGFGPKKAEKAMLDPKFDPMTALSADSLNIYERNLKLVRFLELDKEGWRHVQRDVGHFDPAACLIDFHMLGMPSMAEEKAYNRFCTTFGALKEAKL